MRIHKVPLLMILLLAASVFTTSFTTSGHAQTGAEKTGEVYRNGFWDQTSDLLGSVWEYVSAPFISGTASVLSPPTPLSAIRDIHSEDGSPFWGHLEDAGYQLKEVVTEVGIIPVIEIEFVLARELSEADRNFIERELNIDSEIRRGVFPSIQRKIVWTLLEASDVEGMRIEELKLTMLPLPGVEFVLAPVEAPMGEEHDEIYRSVKDLQKVVSRK